jgi:hypothetical protein
LRRRQLGRSSHVLAAHLGTRSSFCRSGADQIALDIGESSEDGNHQAAGAGAGVGPRFCQRAELRSRVNDALDDSEQVEGRACEPVDPGDRHGVPGDDLFEHFQKLAAVGLRATGLFAVDVAAPLGMKPLKLRIEGLAVSADPSVPETPILRWNFDHILRKR